MINAAIYGLIFLFGIIIGSFLNVCIYRIPRKESIAAAPSHCTHCGTRIQPYDLIPVLSYPFLRGRCRNCNAKISIQYPLVELLAGSGFAFLYSVFGCSAAFAFSLALLAALIVVSLIDLEYKIIPDSIVIFLLIVGILYNAATFDLSFSISSVIGFFAASVPLYVMALMTKGGVGGGDIKLMAVCGLFLGVQNILLAMFLGAILGCVAVFIGSLFKIRKKERTVVFGPFLSIGVMIAFVYGETIINGYLHIVFGYQ